MLSELLLLSGSDIPFPEAKITIHQPTLKEIGYIGEHSFFLGCGLLNFSRDLLNDVDKSRLDNINDFDILMSIMLNTSDATKDNVNCALLVLSLIFPLHNAEVRTNGVIALVNEKETCEINKKNFSIFKEKLVDMFCLDLGEKSSDKYNPSGSMAEKIAKKFQKRHAQLEKLKNETSKGKKLSVLSRYASILAVGLQKDLNELSNYTVFQLYNEFQRFQLKVQWDAYIQARMAGAKDLDEVDNWMIDLSEVSQEKNKKTKK